MRVVHKAYVYLTCGARLLVFDQPDQPAVGLQVPGGTLDPGESHLQGARREFREETGLELAVALDHLTDQEVLFDNERGRDLHCRRLYHARICSAPRESWEHYEMTPSGGGAPIRFHLHWIDLFGPLARDAGRFFLGFGDLLDALRQRVGAGG